MHNGMIHTQMCVSKRRLSGPTDLIRHSS